MIMFQGKIFFKSNNILFYSRNRNVSIRLSCELRRRGVKSILDEVALPERDISEYDEDSDGDNDEEWTLSNDDEAQPSTSCGSASDSDSETVSKQRERRPRKRGDEKQPKYKWRKKAFDYLLK